MAAALAGVFLASPARAENNYEHAKGLIELQWHDLAERFLKDPKKVPDKAEVELGLACLYKGKAEVETADPVKRRELCTEAASHIKSYREVAAKEDRLQGEALNLEAAIKGIQGRAINEIISSAKVSDEEKKKLQQELAELQKKATEARVQAMKAAEVDYAKAVKDWRDPRNNGDEWERKKRAAWEGYVRASQICFNELFRMADQQETGSEQEKEDGRQIVALIEEWRKNQDNKYEPLGDENAGVRMYVDYTFGRGYAFAGDVVKATEAFEKVIGVEPTDFEVGPARSYAIAVRSRAIYYAARALVGKAEKSGKEEDWRKALTTIGNIFVGDPGNEPVLIIDSRITKARCHAKLGAVVMAIDDLNRAVAECEKCIAKARDENEKARYEFYKGKAYREMAAVVLEARKRNLTVSVSPEALVQAGNVCYLQARTEESQGKEAEARSKYLEAVGCLHDAVAMSRARFPEKPTDEDWAARLAIEGEPTAWYLMGNCYHRMGMEIEAQLAYEGGLLSFWGEDGSALPEAFKKKNAALMTQLKGRILEPCANNGRIAANLERQNNSARFNQEQYDNWLTWQIRLDPSMKDEVEWYRALRKMDDGDAAANDAIRYQRNNQPQWRAKRDEALQVFAEAEKAFLGLPDKSVNKEDGIYTAGMCCYKSMSILGRGKTQTAAEQEQIKVLSDRALKHFGDYEDWADEGRKSPNYHPPRPRSTDPVVAKKEVDDAKARRAKRLSNIALTRPFINFEIRNYEEALKGAEALRPRTDLDAGQKQSLHQILFKCYVEIGLREPDIAKMTALLAKSETEANWFKDETDKAQGDEKERLKGLYKNAATRLAAAYRDAMPRIRAKGKEDDAKAAWRKSGEWRKNSFGGAEGIDELYLTGKTFFEVGDYAEARDVFKRLLNDFDVDFVHREGKNDSKFISFDKLKEAVRGSDLELIKEARKRLESIREAFLGGERKVIVDGKETTRPIPKDYDRGVDRIAKFLADYPTYGMEAGDKPGEPRKGLEAIKTELEMRLKLLKASNEITTCCVELGRKALQENNKEEAAKYFKEGMGNAEAAVKYWPKDAEVLYNLAYCLLASGEKANIERALVIFRDLRQGTSDETELWWRATKGFVEGLTELGNYHDARGVLQQILLTYGDEAIKKWWPEIYEVATELAIKMKLDTDPQKALEKFLGEKIKAPKLSYEVKSELEKMIELNIRFLSEDLRDGKLDEAESKFRTELLNEMLALARGRKLKPSELTFEDVVIRIKNGRMRSLVTIGGISRGAENDQTAPPPKAAPPKPKEKEEEKEKPKESGAPAPRRPGRAVAALAGEEGAA